MRIISVNVLLLFGLFANLYGQDMSSGSWQFGYFGDNVTHPGFKISKEYLLRTWSKEKDTKKGKKTSERAYAFSPELVCYRHPKNHFGLALIPAVNYQRTRSTGGYFELRLGLGYHRSFIDGTTYRVNDRGSVENVPFAGQSAWISTLTWSVGKDLRKTKSIPLRYYCQLGASARTPYNHHFLPSVSVGFGVHYFFKSASDE